MTARTKLNITALKAVAQPQPDPVAIANREDAPPAAPKPRAAAVRSAPGSKREEAAPAKRQASRIGKSGIQFWTQPATHKRLKLAALDLDRTVDDILNEAAAEWLERQGRA